MKERVNQEKAREGKRQRESKRERGETERDSEGRRQKESDCKHYWQYECRNVSRQ